MADTDNTVELLDNVEVDLPINSSCLKLSDKTTYNQLKENNDSFVLSKCQKIKNIILLWFQTEFGEVPNDYQYGGVLSQNLGKIINTSLLNTIKDTIVLKLNEDTIKDVVELTNCEVIKDPNNNHNIIINLTVQSLSSSASLSVNVGV